MFSDKKRVALLSISIALLGVTAGSLAIAEPALAARGGKGSSGASIAFNPSQGVVVGAQYQVTVSGLRANAWVTVGAYYPDTTWWSSGKTDGKGTFSCTFTATGSGQILHEAKLQGSNGRVRLVASATLTVSP
jgi:hypothetical protein